MPNRTGNQPIWYAKAAEVIAMPSRSPKGEPSVYKVVIITSDVSVQITMVSIKGSKSETSPSVIGSFVSTAECAIDAVPIPASFEKADLWNPMISAPIAPPAKLFSPNALCMINLNASSIES